MRFTPAQVVAALYDRSARMRNAEVSPDQLARLMTSGLRKLVEEVVDADEERLANYYTLDNALVIADPNFIDLTNNGVWEWLTIQDVTWRSSQDEPDIFEQQIITSTNEERLRMRGEYVHLREPMGYFYDQYRKLRKITGGDGTGFGTSWADVFEVQIFGVQIPAQISAQSGMNAVLDYPRPVHEALVWWMLLSLAGTMKAQDQIPWWASQYADELARLEVEARLATWTPEGIGHLDPHI